VLIGLPDTIWFPENLFRTSVEQGPGVNLVLFPVENPSAFDAVLCNENGRVQHVAVKQPDPGTNWIWGAVTASGRAFHALRTLWESRHREDEYLGHLLNAYIAAGNPVHGLPLGERYMDVGTMEGYRNAQDYLRSRSRDTGEQQKSSAA
jgi:dTDP-glucose pyrophosphorylase